MKKSDNFGCLSNWSVLVEVVVVIVRWTSCLMTVWRFRVVRAWFTRDVGLSIRIFNFESVLKSSVLDYFRSIRLTISAASWIQFDISGCWCWWWWWLSHEHIDPLFDELLCLFDKWNFRLFALFSLNDKFNFFSVGHVFHQFFFSNPEDPSVPVKPRFVNL